MGGFTPASVPPKDVETAASDTLLEESTGEVSTNATTATVVKEIGVPSNRIRTTFRITFTLKIQAAGIQATGRLYHNGTAIGAAQTSTSESYSTKSQDIAIPDPCGTIDLRLFTSNATFAAYSDNLSIKGTETEVEQDFKVIT